MPADHPLRAIRAVTEEALAKLVRRSRRACCRRRRCCRLSFRSVRNGECESARRLTPYRRPTLTPSRSSQCFDRAWKIASRPGSRFDADGGQYWEPKHRLTETRSFFRSTPCEVLRLARRLIAGPVRHRAHIPAAAGRAAEPLLADNIGNPVSGGTAITSNGTTLECMHRLFAQEMRAPAMPLAARLAMVGGGSLSAAIAHSRMPLNPVTALQTRPRLALSGAADCPPVSAQSHGKPMQYVGLYVGPLKIQIHKFLKILHFLNIHGARGQRAIDIPAGGEARVEDLCAAMKAA